MLVDDVDIVIKAGHGGTGRASFHNKKGAGPDGGNGGKGGDVFVEVTSDLYGLNRYVSKKVLVAQNGEAGGKKDKSGADAGDLTLIMPVGTFIIDGEDNEIELNEIGKKVLIAKGGLGGKGNAFFKSSRNTTPRYAQPGLRGEERKLNLKLKLIADFGLIGLPNAGKSSILNELTSASAKIGDYPFTTLEPNLGMLNGKVIADIPGLIEGASEGKGLGHKFLKHIEKVKLLLHCISYESDNPISDYTIIHKELKEYSSILLEKQEIILLTKSDLIKDNDLKKKLKSLAKTKKQIISVSIHDWESLQLLIKILG